MYCPAVFDTYLCWDYTPAGQTAYGRCPHYFMPGFNKDGTNSLCQVSKKTERTFVPGFNKDIIYCCVLLYENYAKVQQRQYEHFMPGFNKDGTNICARVQQRRHEHFIQGSTRTVRTFCARVQQRLYEHFVQGSTKTARTFVSGFNKDGTNICARVQQR